MPLEKQTTTIPLGTGIDTKSDPKLVSENLLELENAVFTSVGQLKKRYGLTSLGKTDGAGVTIDNAKSLTVFQNELCLIDDTSFYSYSEANDTWIEKAKIGGVSLDSLALIRNIYSQSVPDIASYAGVTMYAYEDSAGGIRATVVDQDTGLILINHVVISATGVMPKCSYVNGYLLVWYIVGADLLCSRLTSGNPTAGFSAMGVVVNNINAAASYDIAKYGNNNVLVYKNVAGTFTVGFLKSDGKVAGVIDGFEAAVTIALAVDAVAITSYYNGDVTYDGIYVAYTLTADNKLYGLVLNTNLTVSHGAILISSPALPTRNITLINDSIQSVRVFWELEAATADLNYINTSSITRTGVAGSVYLVLKGVGLLSKVFLGVAGSLLTTPTYDLYIVAGHKSTYQSTSYLVKFNSTLFTSEVINRISYQNSGGLNTKDFSLCNVMNVSTYNWIFANVIKTKLSSESGVIFSNNGISRVTFNFDTSNIFNTAQLGLNLHIGAGMLLIYDGVNLVEAGYNLYPEGAVGTVDDTGGTLVAGVRQWCFTYEWTDAQGQIHRSAPSLPVTYTTAGGTSHVDFVIPTLRLTSRTNVAIITYRTVAAGTVFYRVTSISSPTLSVKTADTVAFADNIADSALIGNELLYTTGGVLENIPPPSATIPYVYNNRLVLAGLEDPNEIWYSRQFSANEAVNFSDLITTRIDQGKRGITSIAQLDEKIVFFKDNNIYIQTASGPTDTGFNNDIGIPQALATDTGCISHKSAIIFPHGLLFKSKKGYYQLDRALQISYVGAPAEAFNDLTCSGAVLIDETNQIRFTHSDGQCVVYDYYIGQWGIFTNYKCVSSRRWNGGYVIARESGVVDKENKSTYLDNGTNVQMRLVTPWIKTAGVQGFQRIYEAVLIGQLNSEHSLRIKIGYNYGSEWRESYSIDTRVALPINLFGSDVVFGTPGFFGGGDSLYQFKINNAIQKCQSIRYEFSDFNKDVTEGSSMNITALTLVLGIKKGAFKVPKIKNV